jgi:hypothetical protein
LWFLTLALRAATIMPQSDVRTSSYSVFERKPAPNHVGVDTGKTEDWSLGSEPNWL